MRDIVYILRDDLNTTELRYSLRSIEQNFPHRMVWFVGGCPKGYKPDRVLKHVQTGENKWERIRSSMYEVIKQDELTDEFFLFNDDFFVMKPFEGEFINYVDGTLDDRINEFRLENNMNRYAQTLVAARNELASSGFGIMNFEVHMPMLFKKADVFEAVKKMPLPPDAFHLWKRDQVRVQTAQGCEDTSSQHGPAGSRLLKHVGQVVRLRRGRHVYP